MEEINITNIRSATFPGGANAKHLAILEILKDNCLIHKITNWSVTPNPTYNCQAFTIGNLDQLLSISSDSLLEKVLQQISYQLGAGKHMLIFDLHSKYSERIKKLGGIFTGYTSSNGSEMIIGVMNVYKMIVKK